MRRRFWQAALGFGAVAVILLGSRLLSQTPPPPPSDENYPSLTPPAQPGDQTPAGGQAGPEVLTRGPIHEAFAEVVSYNPQPGQIIAKEPPKPIEELPPAEKPQGDYAWIPGYWAWDHDRDNFIWVTGAWRIPPPSSTWVPGYWNQVANGYQWVSGYWGPVAAATPATGGQPTSETLYLPPPPQSIEAGPSTAARSPDVFWVPGNWSWVDGRYVWRAGYWGPCQTDWVWIPARYVWTPGGYVFVPGHWDFTLAKRGVVFCPVYYADPYYLGPRYYYTPSVCIQTPILTGYLFCRPAYCHYYFGDYYDPLYLRVGIFPWYMVHERGFGYEPLFVYDRWYFGRRDPGWVMGLHHDYDFRVAHVDARPPHTYAAALRLDTGVGGVRFTLAAPIGRVAAGGGPMRFEHISAERREQFVRAQHEIRQAQAERRTTEFKANAQARANGGRPVRMNVHTNTTTTSRQVTNAGGRAGAGGGTAFGKGTGSTATAGRTGAAGKARPQNSSNKNRDSRDR
jgi:hypothetical protein